MITRYLDQLQRWRIPVLAAWAAVVALSGGLYLSRFHIDNSVSVWFLDDDPELKAYRRHQEEFGRHEWTFLWLEGDSVFAPEFLRDLDRLGTRIESIDGVTRTRSLLDAGTLGANPEGGFGFHPYLSPPANGLPEGVDAETFRRKVREDSRYRGRLVPEGEDDRFTIVAIENANHIDAIDPYRIRLIDEIENAVSDFPGFRDFGLAGTTVINAELNRAARRDMFVYYALIAIFVGLGGALLLDHLRDLVPLGAVVVGTVLPIMGGIAALGLPFNLMTVMLPTLLVTVSVSYLVHFISEFHVHRRELATSGIPAPPAAAIEATFRRLLRPGFWTSVTTVIGFASLTASPVAPIRHVGIFAAAGIGLAWLNTVTVVPCLLGLLWRDAPISPELPEAKASFLDRLLAWLARPHPLLAGILGIAMLAGVAGLPRIEADTDYVKFFRPGSPVREDYAALTRRSMPAAYLTVTVRVPAGTRFADLDRHELMSEFQTELLSFPGVLGIESLDGLVSEFATEFGALGAPGSAVSPTSSSLALFDAGTMEGKEDFLTEEDRLYQLRVLMTALSTRSIEDFRTSLSELARKQPEGWQVSLTGTNVLWANMDGHVIRTQARSVAITAGLLLLLLPLVFRSLPFGLLGFLVSFIPVLCTLGLMGWLGLPINIATCLLGGVVIGLAVDDTIYYLSRIREGLQEGLPMEDAARRATAITGRAMIKTSLILMGGFLTMATSDFLPSVYFGLFFALSILVALLADLIVLPVLLRTVPSRLTRPRPSP